MVKKIYDFNPIILRKKVTSRGGGIEIDLTTLGYKGVKMTAYQNYLGGGILGAVASDCNNQSVQFWLENPELLEIQEQLKEFYHNLTNPEGTWEGSDYKDNQLRRVSAY